MESVPASDSRPIDVIEERSSPKDDLKALRGLRSRIEGVVAELETRGRRTECADPGQDEQIGLDRAAWIGLDAQVNRTRTRGFDERLGPGASGTSEDVEFARRVTGVGIPIGYAPLAIAYHHVDANRLTESYFRESHRRQGVSRFLIRQQSSPKIYFNLARTVVQFGYYSLTRSERKRYRSKGRIYHYLGMLEARQIHTEQRETVATESVMDASSPYR